MSASALVLAAAVAFLADGLPAEATEAEALTAVAFTSGGLPAGATDAEALAAADSAQAMGSAALREAIGRFGESHGSPTDLQLIETSIAAALTRLDRIGPRPCYQEWWSTVRAAYVLFAEAIRGIHVDDAALVQVGFMSGSMLDRLAAQMRPTLAC